MIQGGRICCVPAYERVRRGRAGCEWPRAMGAAVKFAKVRYAFWRFIEGGSPARDRYLVRIPSLAPTGCMVPKPVEHWVGSKDFAKDLNTLSLAIPRNR